jgi:hypothetical protein
LGSPDDGRSRATPHPRAVRAISRGRKSQESTGRPTAPWPGSRSERERTPGGSKASKRACRLPSPASPAVPRRDAEWDAQAPRPTPSDSGEPSSRPSSPASPSGASCGERSARTGKRAANTSDLPRRWAVEREPARKHEARESGYGSPGRESSAGSLQRARAARNKAAKRRGATAKDELRQGLETRRERGQNRRGGQEPRGRHRWRPGDLHPLRHERKLATGRHGAPGVEVLEGARIPREAIPSLTRPLRPTQVDGAGPGPGQPRRGSALKRTRTPREALPGLHRRGSPVERGKPRGRSERRGGRG